MHAHRRLYTSRQAYRDLVYDFASEIIAAADWTGRVRYWEGPITEPQRYWRGSLAQLSQLYQDFAQSVKQAERDAQAAGVSTGEYRSGGSSTAAWWMAIVATDSPPGPTDGPDPGPPTPTVEINKRFIDDHLLDPETPLDFISWHHVRSSAALNADGPYPGLPESRFGGIEPGWCSTAMRTTRAWITDAGGDPDSVEYLLTEWFNLAEGLGSMPEVHVEHLNYPSPGWGAKILGRDGSRYVQIQGRHDPWTMRIASKRNIQVRRVTRLDGSTPYPGVAEPLPPPAKMIEIPADAWEVVIVEFDLVDP